MGRIVSIYGQDGVGKTTLAYGLADRLASEKNLVLIVHTDFTKPVISERIPEIQQGMSLGQLLMTEDYKNIEKTYVPYPKNDNVFLSGILNKENFTSYNRPSPEAVKKYIETVAGAFDYVLIDSTDDVNDELAIAGLSYAGIVIELLRPNIQGVIFQQAYEHFFSKLNTKGKTAYAAAKFYEYNNFNVIERLLGIHFSYKLPYSSEVDFKSMSGSVIKGCSKREGVLYETELRQLHKLVS